jgi:hypothetical protein
MQLVKSFLSVLRQTTSGRIHFGSRSAFAITIPFAAIATLAAARSLTPRSTCAEGGDMAADAVWTWPECPSTWFKDNNATVVLSDTINDFGELDPTVNPGFFALGFAQYGANYDYALYYYPITDGNYPVGASRDVIDTMSVNLPINAEAVMVVGFGVNCVNGYGTSCISDALDHSTWRHDEPRSCVENLYQVSSYCSGLVSGTTWPIDQLMLTATPFNGQPTGHITASFVVDSAPTRVVNGVLRKHWYLNASASSGNGTLHYDWNFCGTSVGSTSSPYFDYESGAFFCFWELTLTSSANSLWKERKRG